MKNLISLTLIYATLVSQISLAQFSDKNSIQNKETNSGYSGNTISEVISGSPKVDCLTCPSYDLAISALSSWQTLNSTIVSDGCRIYQIPVSTSSVYTFKTGCGDGATAVFDTYLELYNSSCSLITYNDDGCESARSIITWIADYNGVAYLKVRGYNSTYFGSFTLAWESYPWCLACPSYDLAITPVMNFQVQNHDISSNGCRIYYLNVVSGNDYTFKTGCGDGASAEFDTYIELYNSSCSLIASDDDGCESNRSIINWTATYTGAAYLKVRGYNYTAFGSFTLAFRGINPSLCKACPSYDYSLSFTDLFQTHSSSILSDGCKIYSFSVASGKEYTFKTGCGDGATAAFDTFLELFDSGCNTITYNDDGCESNRSIITWVATFSGTAYLKVRGYNSSHFGSYTLSFREVLPPNIWLGTVSFYWFDPGNWSLGHVPTISEDIIISPLGHQPCYLVTNNQEGKSLEIQSGATLIIGDQELTLLNELYIFGTLSMTGSSVVRLRGNWWREQSSGVFSAGTGKVVFDGDQTSSILYTDETFNVLEVNKTGLNAGLLIQVYEVSCQQYNWTQGGIYVGGYGIFNAFDLVDNGIFGTWYAFEGGTINVYNYGGWIDLNGQILLDNGNMNVYGGTTYSYWPYVGNAEIHLTSGILDFKDQGIFINNDAPGYTLTENITGGTIRTTKGFIGNRSDFTPSGGTFEFYGTSDYLISQSNGCTLHNVTINKSAKEGEKTYPTGPLTDERSGLKISDGGKSNTITLDSDFTMTGDLLIDWNSALNLGSFDCNVSGGISNYGIISIPNNTDLSANSIYWHSGSQSNINTGTIHVSNWTFGSGSMANIGAGNTAYVDGWISMDYCSSAFGSLVLEAASKSKDDGSKSPTIMINGNFTVSTGSNWTLLLSAEVQGNFYSQPYSYLTFDPKSLSVAGNAAIAGYAGFLNGGAFTTEGDLNLLSTGSIEMDEGIFTCIHPGAATLDGALIMNSPSLVSFPERSVTIGPNFNDNGITGGTFLFGASLHAPTPGMLQINAASTEFVSFSSSQDEIALGSNNWLGNVLIQRSMYIEVTDNLTIKGNLNITDNKLQVNGKILTVEGAINVPHGILSLFTGSQLNIGGSLTVGTYGLFETYGTSGNGNRVFGGSYGNYGLTVNSGGVIRGDYTTFEDMDDHGIWVQSGAIIDPASSLNNCTFKNGAAGGGLLTIENTQSLTIQNPNFPVITPGGGYNIIKTSSSGTIEMNSATGVFAGPAFENDPYSRINWIGGMAGLWTGNISPDWFNISNWSSFTVPDATVSVLIPPGCPNYPVVNGAQGHCYNLTVDPGANLIIGNNKLQASNFVYISGNLTMTDALGCLQAEEVYFLAGSTDNVNNGEIRTNYFEFNENTFAKFSGLNTVYCAWANSEDPGAEFANLHIVPYSKKSYVINGSKTSYTIRVTGDFVMEPGTFFTPYANIEVSGNTEIQSGATLGDYSGPELGMTCNGNLTIAGIMRLYYSSEVVVHGNLSLTGYLTIFPDCEFTCDYNSASGWTTLDGVLDLYPGSDFNITGANVFIGPLFSFIEYAPYGSYFNSAMTIGRSLSAPSPNFQLDYTYTSFTGSNIGHYIELHPANYLLDFVVNKYSSGDLYLQSDITVVRTVSIADETILRAYDKTIYLGGDWYENYFSGGGGFEPMTGRVILIGESDQTVYGTADFNILQNYNMYGNLVIPAGSTVNCQSYDYTTGGIRVDGGNFTAYDLFDPGIYGSFELISGAISLTQDAGQGTDLHGNLNISGGIMTITNGIGPSSWGFGDNCSITMSNGTLDFQNLGIWIYNNPAYTFSENITGGTIKTTGGFTADHPNFTPSGGTVQMVGGIDAGISLNPGCNFYHLTINKSGGKEQDFSETILGQPETKDPGKGNMVVPLSNLVILGNLTVAKGALNLAGHEVKIFQSATISNGGTLIVDAGADLLMGANQTLAVTEGGKLYVVGSSGNDARISRISAGNYTFNVDPNGTIAADYGIFEYMGTNGVNLKATSHVDPLYPFNHCTFRNGTSGGRHMTISNTEAFTITAAVFPTNTWGGSYNVFKNSASGTVNFAGATGGFAGAAYEYDPNNLVNWTTLAQTFNLKSYLEGAFNPASGTMRTDLNTILPFSQPYHPALPYFGNPMPDWYYGGSESVGAIPNSLLVDWVIVQLREGTSPATATTILATQAAFINNAGNIVGLDGTSPLNFTISYSLNLYAVIWHRNHLGIISANPLANIGGFYTYDFSSGSGQAWGGTSAQKQLATSIWGMISGDGDGSGGVAIQDGDNVWDVQAGKTGYLPSDHNMNRQTNNTDKNDKWVPNIGKGSQVP